jgi:hypothetical protein
LRAPLAIAATVVLFIILFLRIPLRGVWSSFQGADPILLAAALLLTGLFPLLSALRWRRMLRLLGYGIPLGTAFRLIMAAWPVGAVTPSKSGDLIKAYYLKGRVPVGLTLGSVLAERALDVLVLLAMSTAGAALFRWDTVLLVSGGGLAAVTAGVGLLVATGSRWPVPKPLKGKLDDLLRAFRVLLADPPSLGLVLFYTAANWFLSILQTYLCFHALHRPVSLALTAGALPLAIFVGLLPFTVSGMGTRDGALVLLYRGHAPAEVTLAVGILYTFFGYWMMALAGLPFLKKALPEGRGALMSARGSGGDEESGG